MTTKFYNLDIDTTLGNNSPSDNIVSSQKAIKTYIDNNINAPRNIGEIIASTIPLTDAGLHLLDGSKLLYASYKDFIDYIATLYNSGNYSNIFETEANWQTSVTTYGVCGKFVYDSINNTVRLPKLVGIIEGTTDVNALGDLIEESLPNIKSTGTIGAGGRYYYGGNSNSALYASNYVNTAPSDGNYGAYANLNFDASRYSSTYQDDADVQPQTIRVLYYIVVATSTKTDIQVNIDQVATDLNGKADVDLTNVNNSGMIRSVHWTMPSTTYDNLTVGSSGTSYTAPTDGWVKFSAQTNNNNQFVQIQATMTGLTVASGTLNVDAFIPIRKGETFTIYYTAPNNKALRFYYAVGSESEHS